MACEPATLTFWIDHKADIHGDVPDNVPRSVENQLLGTYGAGASVSDIEADLRTERRERARAWITDMAEPRKLTR